MKDGISYTYSHEKNAKLLSERGVGFEDVICAIANDKVLDVLSHHNKKDYPDQYILVVEVDNYAYQVPFQHTDRGVHLITVFPSRKCTKKYLSAGGQDEA